MFDFLENEISVWNRLKEANLPIMLYGMGDGADKIMRELERIGLSVSEIFASDEFVRGHSYRGYLVRKFSEICSLYPRFIILVAFGVHDDKTMNRLYEMSKNYELYAPDVPVVGDRAFDHEFVKEHYAEFSKVYDMLEDEWSKKVFKYSLKYKISGKIEYLKAMESAPDEVYNNLIRPTSDEIYLDLGAYDGDTIREFLSFTGGKAREIIALEPDKRNFKKLLQKNDGITAIQAGAWSEDCTMLFSARGGRNSSLGVGVETEMRSVDSLLLGKAATYIKFDVEGAEYEALCGARNTIAIYKPKLFAAVYHRNEDMFRLPLLIKELNPEYRLYLRHYPYIPAWETNIIAI